jgi:hypothetical protein
VWGVFHAGEKYGVGVVKVDLNWHQYLYSWQTTLLPFEHMHFNNDFVPE